MKKLLILFISLFVLAIPYDAFCSTTVLPRDDNDMGVWDTIDTKKYYNDIMNTPRVNVNEKVYDFADLYNDEEEAHLYTDIMKYVNTYQLDFIVVTINDNNKGTARKYAEDFYAYNYFGSDNTKRSGSIFIIDMDTREFYIATTGDAIKYYDDVRIDHMLDSIFNDVKNKNYYAATSLLIDTLYSYGTSVPASNQHVVIDNYGHPKEVKVHKPNLVISIGLGLVGAFIFVSSNIAKHTGIHLAVNADNYLDGKASKVYPAADKFIATHTSVRVIHNEQNHYNSSSHSSFSGRVGGSSVHISSGGRSFGGGGRHF